MLIRLYFSLMFVNLITIGLGLPVGLPILYATSISIGPFGLFVVHISSKGIRNSFSNLSKTRLLQSSPFCSGQL